MYRLFIAILLLTSTILLTTGCGRKLALETSRYQSPSLVIDGAGDDWNKLPRFYDQETKLSYDISNDSKNLYVVLKAVDNEMKSKILRGGFNVWIDTTWQRKQDRGLRFPLPAGERTVQYGGKQDGVNNPDMKEMQRKFAKNIQEMDLINLAGGKTARTTSQNPYGVSAAVSLDKEGTMFYELSIPLNVIFKDSVTMPLVKRKLSIGLVSNKAEAKPMNDPSEHKRGDDQFGQKGTGSLHGGDMMQNGSGHGGYGQGGGGGMPSATRYEPSEKQVNLWMVLQLVQHDAVPSAK